MTWSPSPFPCDFQLTWLFVFWSLIDVFIQTCPVFVKGVFLQFTSIKMTAQRTLCSFYHWVMTQSFKHIDVKQIWCRCCCPPLLSSTRHSAISPPGSHTFIYSTFLLVISAPPHTHISSCLPLFCSRDPVSPHMPPFLSPSMLPCLPLFFSIFFSFLTFSLWITPERSRNIAGCQLDERGHTGPADLVMLSHHKASLSLCLSLPLSLLQMHTQSGFSQISLSTRLLLCHAALTSRDPSEPSSK